MEWRKGVKPFALASLLLERIWFGDGGVDPDAGGADSVFAADLDSKKLKTKGIRPEFSLRNVQVIRRTPSRKGMRRAIWSDPKERCNLHPESIAPRRSPGEKVPIIKTS